MERLKTLNIVGAGKVGKTLGYLFAKKGLLQIQCIVNRSLASAQQACEFIGQGKPVTVISNLLPADIYMLSVTDDQIEGVCQQLVLANKIPKDAVIFHCSGALSSSVLASVKKQQFFAGSFHPVHSFVNPKQAINKLEGKYGTVEGDAEVCSFLKQLGEQLGMKTLQLKSEQKILHHAATVMACNYLVSLMEISLQCLDKSSIKREQAYELIQPLVEGTMKNIFSQGTAAALTGPIARGDCHVVAEEIKALTNQNADVALLYRLLGKVALQLAGEKKENSDETQQAMLAILNQ